MQAGRVWRRTTTERNGRIIPLSDDWSLIDIESGLAVAQIRYEPAGEPRGWRCICRSLIDNDLKDTLMAWFETGKAAKFYAEGQTGGQNYIVKRKRTKAEILAHAGVRPTPKNKRQQ